LESNNSTGANQQRQLAQNGSWVRKPHQNETAYGCIEGFTCGDLGNIGLDKAHITQASFSHASPRAVEGARVALDSHNLSGRTNDARYEHGDVSDSGTDIQNTLTWTNACFTEESFGNRGETRSLSDQAFVLRVRAAKNVIKGGIVHCYLSAGFYST